MYIAADVVLNYYNKVTGECRNLEEKPMVDRDCMIITAPATGKASAW